MFYFNNRFRLYDFLNLLNFGSRRFQNSRGRNLLYLLVVEDVLILFGQLVSFKVVFGQ